MPSTLMLRMSVNILSLFALISENNCYFYFDQMRVVLRIELHVILPSFKAVFTNSESIFAVIYPNILSVVLMSYVYGTWYNLP